MVKECSDWGCAVALFQSPSNRVNIPNLHPRRLLPRNDADLFQSPSNWVNIPNPRDFFYTIERLLTFQSPSNRVNIPNIDFATEEVGEAELMFQSPSNRVNIPNT